MSAGRIAQHRNYNDIITRHGRDIKIRRVIRVFIYFLIIAFLTILFMIVSRWEEKQEIQDPATAAVVVPAAPNGPVASSDKTFYTWSN
jgi:hypothetical protein